MRTIITALAMVLTASVARGTEYLSMNDEFGITRDFSEIVIAGHNLQTARLFVDQVHILDVSRSVSHSEVFALQQVVTDTLMDKVYIVAEKAEANYNIVIIINNYTNYAIRNQKRIPVHGQVTMAICVVPIADMTVDCETITYYYFKEYVSTNLIRHVLAMWMPVVFPSSTR